jgi:hypothetical protein
MERVRVEVYGEPRFPPMEASVCTSFAAIARFNSAAWTTAARGRSSFSTNTTEVGKALAGLGQRSWFVSRRLAVSVRLTWLTFVQ